MAQWTAFPYDDADYLTARPTLAQDWARLHAGDAEALPRADAVLEAWALFHAGKYQAAFEAGLKAAQGGEPARLHRRQQGAGDLRQLPRAQRDGQAGASSWRWPSAPRGARCEDPKDANAWYCLAYGLGRYSQSISIAKALAQGLGGKVKHALETTIRLAPKHADAHIALGRVPCRSHRQGRLPARAHPGGEQGRRACALQDRAEAQPALGDRDDRIRQRAW